MFTTQQQATLIAANEEVQAFIATTRGDALTRVQALCLLEKYERNLEIDRIDELMTERKTEFAQFVMARFEAATPEVIDQLFQENIMSHVNAAFEANATAAEEAVVETKSLFARLKAAASTKLATVKAYASSFAKKNVEAGEEAVEKKPMSRAAKVALVCAGVALVGAATAAVVAPAAVMAALAVVAGFISAALVACKDFFASLLAKLAGVFTRTAEAAGEAAETVGEVAAA